MYNGVNEGMVEAKVAIKHETEAILDIHGNKTNNPLEQFRRKTRYQLNKPE
jgi:hypothetical protein